MGIVIEFNAGVQRAADGVGYSGGKINAEALTPPQTAQMLQPTALWGGPPLTAEEILTAAMSTHPACPGIEWYIDYTRS